MADANSKGPAFFSGIVISGIIALASSIFLLVYDKNLMKHGMLHWDALIAYVVIVAILLALSSGGSKGVLTGLIAIPAIFIVLVLLDATLNLPISGFYSTSNAYLGWRYLFGFGYGGDGSTIIRSTALVIDLIFSASLLGFSAGSLRRR